MTVAYKTGEKREQPKQRMTKHAIIETTKLCQILSPPAIIDLNMYTITILDTRWHAGKLLGANFKRRKSFYGHYSDKSMRINGK